MVLVVKVELKEAEKVKGFLLKNDLFDKSYIPVKEKGFIYFPVKRELKGYKVKEKKLRKIKKGKKVDDLLRGKLSKEELNLIPATFDEIGDILVLELGKELEKKKKIIGEAFLKAHERIKTVLKKKAIHKGVYRLRKLEVIAGEKKKETVHKENGVLVKVDLEKMYFSSRLGAERLRIAKLVEAGEEVLVMFSGSGVYPLVVARNSGVKEVVGVELNPRAHKYAEENVKLNRLWGKSKLFKGGVRKVLPKLGMKFDRVVMPLPKTGEKFLGLALKMVKKGGVVHYYDFLNEKEIPEIGLKKIKEACAKAGKKGKVLNWRKCGVFAPYVYRVVYDFEVL